MDSFNESSLSAYFPGLVDVCVDDEGQLVYVILKDGEQEASPVLRRNTSSSLFPVLPKSCATSPRKTLLSMTICSPT
jgi:hypothetical protein